MSRQGGLVPQAVGSLRDRFERIDQLRHESLLVNRQLRAQFRLDVEDRLQSRAGDVLERQQGKSELKSAW